MIQQLVITIVPAAFAQVVAAQAEPPLERLVNGLAFLILLAISLACLIAYLTVLSALLPGPGEQSKRALQKTPWRAFFIGLANYLFLGGIGLILLNIEPLIPLGLIILAFLVVGSSFGLIGLAGLTGERLAGQWNRSFTPWPRLVLGTLALALAGLLPVAGWFLFTPAALMISFGSAALAWRNRKEVQPVAIESMEPDSADND